MADHTLAKGSPTQRAASWKYNPHTVTPEELEATFAGTRRRALLDELMEQIRRKKNQRPPKHLLITGPRGLGKSTVLLRVYHRFCGSQSLSSAFRPVMLSEEEHFITNVNQLCQRALQLSGIPATNQPPRAVVSDAVAADGRPFLLFVDNLSNVLRSILPSAQRDSEPLVELLTSGDVIVLAAAVDPGPYFKRIDHLFEGPIPLSDLENGEELLRLRAIHYRDWIVEEAMDERPDLIKSVSHLAGGNPRYMVYLYELLGDRPLPDLVTIAKSMLDAVTPLFQDVVGSLEPAERRTLDALCRAQKACTAAELATLMGEDTDRGVKKVQTWLGRIAKTGVVRIDKGIKPQRYRAHPPLLQRWYEMRYLGIPIEQCLIPLLDGLATRSQIVSYARQILSGSRAPEQTPGVLSTSTLALLLPLSDVISEQIKARALLEDIEAGRVPRRIAELREAWNQSGDDPSFRSRTGLVLAAYLSTDGQQEFAGEILGATMRIAARAEYSEVVALSQVALAELMFDEGAYDKAVALLSEVLDEVSPSRRPVVHKLRGDGYANLGRWVDARAEYEAAMPIMQWPHSKEMQAQLLASCALAEFESMDPENAAVHAERAARLYRGLGWTSEEAQCLELLGVAHIELRESRAAIEVLTRAIERYSEAGDEAGIVSSHRNIGMAYRNVGDLDDALKHFVEARRKYVELRDLAGEARALFGLGLVHNDRMEYREARAQYERALQIHTDQGDGREVAKIAAQLSNVHLELGDPEAAQRSAERAMQYCVDHQHIQGQAVCHLRLGSVHFAQQNLELARKAYENAVHLFQNLGDRSGEADATGSLGRVSAASGWFDKAQVQFRRALDIHRDIGDRRGKILDRASLGRVLYSLGQIDDATAEFISSTEIAIELQGSSLLRYVASQIAESWIDSLRRGRTSDALRSATGYLDSFPQDDGGVRTFLLTPVVEALDQDELPSWVDEYLTQIGSALERPQAIAPLAAIARIREGEPRVEALSTLSASGRSTAEQLLERLDPRQKNFASDKEAGESSGNWEAVIDNVAECLRAGRTEAARQTLDSTRERLRPPEFELWTLFVDAAALLIDGSVSAAMEAIAGVTIMLADAPVSVAHAQDFRTIGDAAVTRLPHDQRILISELADVIIGRRDLQAYSRRLQTGAAEEVRRLLEEDGNLLFGALKDGRIKDLQDAERQSIRARGVAALLTRIGREYSSLDRGGKSRARTLVLQSLASIDVATRGAAIRASGRILLDLPPSARTKVIDALFERAADGEELTELRENAIGVFAAAFPFFTEIDRQFVLIKARELAETYRPKPMRNLLSRVMNIGESSFTRRDR